MGTDPAGRPVVTGGGWYIVTLGDGRTLECYNWFEAYNELAAPDATGSIEHLNIVLARKDSDGNWEWSKFSREPGFDLDVEED